MRARSLTRIGKSATSRCSRRSRAYSPGLAGAIRDPVLDDYWPRAVRRRARPTRWAFASPWRELEESWGVSTWSPTQHGLPDRWFPLVRCSLTRPASPLPGGAQHLPGRVSSAHIGSRSRHRRSPRRRDEWLEARSGSGAGPPRRRHWPGRDASWSCIMSQDQVMVACFDAGWEACCARRTAPRLGPRERPAAASADHHNVQPVLARRPVHPRYRRRQVRQLGDEIAAVFRVRSPGFFARLPLARVAARPRNPNGWPPSVVACAT